MKKLTILLLTLLLSAFQAEAQRLQITRFLEDTSDLTARSATTGKQDFNGNYCGLIRVRCAGSGVSFESKYIKEVEQSTKEYLVWMNPNATNLTIKVPGYLPFKVDFKDRGLKDGIRSKTTYVMVIEDPQYNTRNTYLSFRSMNGEGCTIHLKGPNNFDKTYTTNMNGLVENLCLPDGTYSYTASKKGFHSDSGKITLTGVPVTEQIRLEPVTTTTPTQKPTEKPKEQPKQEQKAVAKAEPKQEQKAVQQTAATPTTPKVMISNVDKSIPVSGQVDKNTFVVVIGNEKYEDADPVPFAENDARIFSEYCKKTLGISEKHIRAVYNAGYNDIRKALSWLKQGLSAYEGEGRVIFYYSGHGIPNEADMSAYLLPVDGDGKDIESAYPLSSLYKSLSELPAKSVLVFLDACFSGAKRNGGMLVSARGVAIKAKPQEAKGKMVIFSAAQSDETAYPFTSQQHGMFTYYLLKKLYDTKGQVTLGELGDYLRKEVKRESFDENNKIQTPTVSASAALTNSWRTIRLK